MLLISTDVWAAEDCRKEINMNPSSYNRYESNSAYHACRSANSLERIEKLLEAKVQDEA